MTLEQRITALAQATGADIKALQAAVAAAGGAVTGDARLTAAAPGAGWLPATGGVYPRANHPALASMLGVLLDRPFDATQWASNALAGISGAKAIGWGDGVFVCAAYNSARVFTSTDGSGWTQRTLPATNYWRTVAYGNGVFVVASESSAYNAVAVSTDGGVSWTLRTLPATGNWSALAYGNGRFVALRAGSNRGVWSSDGVTWTPLTLPTSANWGTLVWGGGRFVAVSRNSSVTLTSPDGVTWTQSAAAFVYGTLGLAYGAGLLVCAPDGMNGKVYTSPDGIAWTERPLPAALQMAVVAWTGSAFVGLLSSSSELMVSANGVDWVLYSGLPGAYTWAGCAAALGRLVAVATTSPAVALNRSAISYDALTHFAVPALATQAPLKWYLKT